MEATETSILQEKVESLLKSRQGENGATLERIERDNSLLQDYVLPLGPESPIKFMSNGAIKMRFDGKSYGIHKNALGQLGDKFGVPQRYLNYLSESEWGRKLAKKVLTEHKDNIGRSRVLVRGVGDQVRAVLSDRYRRLNSDKIFEAFILGSKNSGAVIYDAQYTETKSYISTIIPRVFEIETENNGMVHSVFGARIANSDYGDGALNVSAFQMNVVCLNGMVSTSELKQIHLGRQLPQNIQFSNRTYQLDTQTMASAVSDIMGTVLGSERIKRTASKIKEASASEVDLGAQIKKLPKMGMLKEEVLAVEKKLMQNNAEDGVTGKPTMWKLSQAITAVSNDIGDRRKQELDELAGQLIKL